MAEINNQNKIKSKANFKYLNKKLRLIENVYKMLFMGKLANLLAFKIYNKYAKVLKKLKIQIGKDQKDIIVAKGNRKEFNNIDNTKVNLIIDFLRFIWNKTSSIIHLKKRNFPFQKEVLSEYLKVKNSSGKKINVDETIELKKISSVLYLKVMKVGIMYHMIIEMILN